MLKNTNYTQTHLPVLRFPHIHQKTCSSQELLSDANKYMHADLFQVAAPVIKHAMFPQEAL